MGACRGLAFASLRGTAQELSFFPSRPVPLLTILQEEFPGSRVVKDPAWSLLWLQFDSWPWELTHAMGVAKGKKKKQNPLRTPFICSILPLV